MNPVFTYDFGAFYRCLRLLDHCPKAKFTPKRSTVIKNKQLRKRRKK